MSGFLDGLVTVLSPATLPFLIGGVALGIVLGAIPGVTLREMTNSDRCCGSAGLYSAVQPGMSAQVLEPKMATIAATGATTVCTSNLGCTLQIETGARRHNVDAEVRHVIEVLAESIEAGRAR